MENMFVYMENKFVLMKKMYVSAEGANPEIATGSRAGRRGGPGGERGRARWGGGMGTFLKNT